MKFDIKTLLSNEKVKGTIALAAAVIMWFTPDHVDSIIETILAALGISKLVVGKEENKGK